MNCFKCQNPVGEKDPFCPECGVRLTASKGFRNYLIVNLFIGAAALFVSLGGAIFLLGASTHSNNLPYLFDRTFDLANALAPFSMLIFTPYFLLSSVVNFIYARKRMANPLIRKIIIRTAFLFVVLILSFPLQLILLIGG